MLNNFPRRVLNRLQPITRRHVDRRPISDLFPWIVSDLFDTSFQSHDIASLFCPTSVNSTSTCLLVAFNSAGVEILRQIIPVQSLYKSPISLSFLLRSSSFEFGTFSLFHNHNPDILVGTPSVLSDRGYAYFTQRHSDFRHYVHGNFDAVTLNRHGRVTSLGGISFFNRTYNFQYSFSRHFDYDLFFVNPTSSPQSIHIYESLSQSIHNLKCIDSFTLSSRGSHIFRYRPSHDCAFLAFRSKIVLCRPICFKRVGSAFDVFHA